MFRLALILYAMIGTSLAGILMVVALTTGYDTTQPVVISALIGFIIGAPAAWMVARAIS
ncbi:CTP synthetase [Aliiroseovarius sp.]|uniref:CTP synthetase n=1 Tax=Aliiroseovarius sp. TaxID=1872442 RepID=UPI00260D56E8|nr:CTP synthetase [Aliiroseovarius sp.]